MGSTGKGARAAGTIVVEQYRSGICCQERQKRTLRALGLRRIRQKVEHPDNGAVRGMVAAIPHLVRVVAETSGRAGTAGRTKARAGTEEAARGR